MVVHLKKECIFAGIIKKQKKDMESVVIKPHSQSDVRFLLDFAKRIGVPAKVINTEEIEDARFVSLIEEGLKTDSVSRNEVMKALRQ